MAKSNYPDEVWEAIKTLWEGVPKITWAEVIKQVGDTYKCDMPNISAVSKRATKENWKKIGKSNRKTKGEEIAKNELKTIGYVDFVKEKIQEKINHENLDNQDPKEVITRIFKQVVEEGKSEQSRIIKIHREQADYLSDLYQSLLSQADSLFSLELRLDDPNFDEIANKHAKMVTLAEKKTNIALMLATVGKMSQERVFKAWGITEVTNEDAEKARKQDVEKLNEELAKERDEVKAEQQRLFVERTRLIESGTFEVRPVEGDIDVLDDER